jgi:hypothetical protein
MNREDILRMGRQAGAFIELAQEKDLLWLERFATLVAFAEREACAKLVDYWESRQGEHSDAIRARTQA